MSRFNSPAPVTSTAGYRHADHIGHLIIAEGPIARREEVTQHGPATVAVPRRLHCVDTGEMWDEPWIFGAVIVNQMTTAGDGDILGRIGKGEAMPGKSAPWVLEEPTAGDIAAAESYVENLSF